MTRILDIIFSLFGLIMLSPAFIILTILIKVDSQGPVFYKQIRVGKNGIDFKLFKFRSMNIGSDNTRLLTVGENDPRITRTGHFLRKLKIDELPQLFNVLLGEMSLVGPRPEVRKYVDLYTDKQRCVLNLKPGMTDFASIHYVNENRLLANSEDPEKLYIEKIMPEKIELNLKYINEPTISQYFKILYLTIISILW
jgi:lipopolysaccharide/colanic/teichoic acid biosynthesis glycosyltransferase